MPGVNVQITTTLATEVSPTETGKVFDVNILERGSVTEAIVCHSLAEVKVKCGSKISQSVFFESAEAFFEEGGATLIVGRVEGTGAASASVELAGSGATKVVKIAAASPGTWGNSLGVKVAAGEGTNVKIVVLESGTVVEESPELNNQAALTTWAEKSLYVHAYIIIGGSFLPSVNATEQPLSGGTNEYGGATTARYEAALERFYNDYGAGQVTAWGVTTAGVQAAIQAHAETHNRTALPDLRNIVAGESAASYATVLIAAVSAMKTNSGARRSATYAPWAIIPGTAPSLPTRVVPYSAIQAGIFARNDGSNTPPPVNEPSAGDNGIARYAIGVTTEFHRAVREELNAVGINAIRVLPSRALATYGNRSLISPLSEPAWAEISAGRLVMFVYAEGVEILERFVFDEIDPHGLLFQRVGGEMQAFLESLGNMLYNDPREAVNVGPNVNTETTIRNRELNCAVKIQPSPIAETINLMLSVKAV